MVTLYFTLLPESMTYRFYKQNVLQSSSWKRFRERNTTGCPYNYSDERLSDLNQFKDPNKRQWVSKRASKLCLLTVKYISPNRILLKDETATITGHLCPSVIKSTIFSNVALCVDRVNRVVIKV
ncbi:hypothetical protein RF11_13936 [Thelohanellus kitauei]|uniref:Uncharacterized protein n=1 Tax=Thelohanellus kitauei TaxID=669202 RepID=A0A0C2I6Y5_THEKT|nr:hypothetical protein RF11_13935 [Thelohanellus kitauei]KII60963.1 hypothetical protein RF11_13936 [Thelohanellus kitauei]